MQDGRGSDSRLTKGGRREAKRQSELPAQSVGLRGEEQDEGCGIARWRRFSERNHLIMYWLQKV